MSNYVAFAQLGHERRQARVLPVLEVGDAQQLGHAEQIAFGRRFELGRARFLGLGDLAEDAPRDVRDGGCARQRDDDLDRRLC